MTLGSLQFSLGLDILCPLFHLQCCAVSTVAFALSARRSFCVGAPHAIVALNRLFGLSCLQHAPRKAVPNPRPKHPALSPLVLIRASAGPPTLAARPPGVRVSYW